MQTQLGAKMIITLEIGENEVKTATPIKPIPPNFNKIEARIIDPIIGVSTWALGSHKWVIKIGNFTKNANLIANLVSQLNLLNLWFRVSRPSKFFF